jgi:hypothetical protein
MLNIKVSIYGPYGLVMIKEVQGYSVNAVLQYYLDYLKAGYYAIVEEIV